MLNPNESPKFRVYIDPTAVIEHGVTIGEHSKIWHFCHISKGAVIGERCTLGQNVYVGPYVKIGDGCKIQNNVSVYAGVILEHDVFIGPSAVFTNVLTPRANFDRHEKLINTLVREGASIGANATILCGHTIGAYAMIGAGSVVTCSVPDFKLFYGNPARLRGVVCICGNVWKDYTKPCPVCQRKFIPPEDL